jgi:hypothetical protein
LARDLKKEAFMKVLSPRVHGLIADYPAIAILYLAPTLFDFSSVAASICYVVATIHLVMTISTAYPVGLIKAVPFTLHGRIEFLTSLALMAMPWLAGFSEDTSARNFYVTAGVVLLAVWAVTDYRGAGTRRGRMGGTMTRDRESVLAGR